MYLSGTPATSTATTSAGGAQPTASGSTTSTTPSVLNQMSFTQMQELMNKWSVELNEMEKSFIDQATKVNSWDQTVMNNGEKVSILTSFNLCTNPCKFFFMKKYICF